MRWEVSPKISCGTLRFGMGPIEVSQHLGAPDKIQHDYLLEYAEQRNNAPWKECAYSKPGLERISANLHLIGQLCVFDANLLDLPILDVLGYLGDCNGGIYQAQGGSVYFDQLGIAILQFEERSIREVVLFSSSYDHHEPLRLISRSEAEEYYVEIMERDPSQDRLGL